MIEQFGLSSLALSLLALALAGLAAVVVHNIWSMRRRRAGLRDRSVAAATAAEEGAVRPSGAGPVGGGPAPAETDEEAASATLAAAVQSSDAQAPAARLDPRTDCIVEFVLDTPVAGERMLAIAQGVRRAGGKPVGVEGLAATILPAGAPADGADVADPDPDDPAPGSTWAPLSVGQRFERVRIGVLLANRHGPLNAMEYSEFVAGVQALADQLGLLGYTPDMNAVLQRARALDERFAALDAQVGINVQVDSPLGLPDLAGVAQACGCVERGNNRYALLAAGGEVLFSMSLSDLPDRLSLLLDVPRAPAAEQPWERMVESARRCAEALGGRLVDDQGRPLSDAALARIGGQLAERQRSLAEAGVEPGTPLALRVFN
jgi:hypothetical protein